MLSFARYVPSKATLLLLFDAARRRVARNTEGAGNLSPARIESATEELNQIADDVRDATPALEFSPSTGSPTKIKSPRAVAATAATTPTDDLLSEIAALADDLNENRP